MKNIHTEIEIKAPASRVWGILMDFEKYPEWNPFIKSISGEQKLGGKLKADIQLPGNKPMTFKPEVTEFSEAKCFSWLGNLILPGLFDGEHIFRLKEKEGGVTHFVQTENFRGILVPLFWKSIDAKTLKGFESMNKALKQRAEA